MTIYTRFGTAVEVLSYTEDERGGWLKVRFHHNGEEGEYQLSEFKADGGLNEIKAVIDALQKPVEAAAFDLDTPLTEAQHEQVERLINEGREFEKRWRAENRLNGHSEVEDYAQTKFALAMDLGKQIQHDQDELLGSTASFSETHVLIPKAVAEAFANALIAIDQFAPQEKPEEPAYAALQSNVEVIAAASAYSIALTAWGLAQHARQALSFARIAAEEPDSDGTSDDDEVSTRRLPLPIDFIPRPAETLFAGCLIVLDGMTFEVQRTERNWKTPYCWLDLKPLGEESRMAERHEFPAREMLLSWFDESTRPDWHKRLHPNA